MAEYPSDWGRVYEEWKNDMITAKVAIERLQMKRTTFNKLVNKYEEKIT